MQYIACNTVSIAVTKRQVVQVVACLTVCRTLAVSVRYPCWHLAYHARDQVDFVSTLSGIVEVYCKIPRFCTVMAVRDSEVVRIPVPLLDFLVINNPTLVTRLIKYLGKSVAFAVHKVSENPGFHGFSQLPGTPDTITTVAVIPCDKLVPLDTFVVELECTLKTMCRTTRISSDDVKCVRFHVCTSFVRLRPFL